MNTLEQKFSFSSFCRASSVQRKELCSALTVWLKKAIRPLTNGLDDTRRREVIYDMIACLRQLGHDLMLYDWADDFEEWIHNYKDPKSVGLWITIDFEDNTEVFWHEFPEEPYGVVLKATK